MFSEAGKEVLGRLGREALWQRDTQKVDHVTPRTGARPRACEKEGERSRVDPWREPRELGRGAQGFLVVQALCGAALPPQYEDLVFGSP